MSYKNHKNIFYYIEIFTVLTKVLFHLDKLLWGQRTCCTMLFYF